MPGCWAGRPIRYRSTKSELITIMSVSSLRPLIFSKKQLTGLYCHDPFMTFNIDVQGNVHLCLCSGWQPISIGNIFESTIEELLSSPLATNIRASIIDGSYMYCNESTCSLLSDTLKGGKSLLPREHAPPDLIPLFDDPTKYIIPRQISIAGDLTCNLSCPSCRKKVIKPGPENKDRFLYLGNVLAKNLFSVPTDKPITLLLSTSGELFASTMLLNFLNSIKKSDFPNLTLDIQTNGLLCEKNWHKLKEFTTSINKITITADSCRPGVYETLRRGGTYPELIKAMEFLSKKKKETGMKFHVRMVIQNQNYQEAQEFYDFAKKYDADLVEYIRLQMWWGARTAEEHVAEDVFDLTHPNYADACNILSRVKQLPDTWMAGGLP